MAEELSMPSQPENPAPSLSLEECKRILHNMYYESQSLWQMKQVLDSFDEYEKIYQEHKTDFALLDAHFKDLQQQIAAEEQYKTSLEATITSLTAQRDQLLATIEDVKSSFTALIEKGT